MEDISWVPSPISNKSGLTITIAVNSTCVGQQIYDLRYHCRETPCFFKQAAIYSGTDSNLKCAQFKISEKYCF